MAAPLLAAQIQGQASVSADNLNTYEQTCDNLAQLRGFIGLPGIQVFARGFSVPNDGGAGEYFWDASATAADNNVSVIVPYGVGQGAWIKLTGNIIGNQPSILVKTTNYTVAASDILSGGVRIEMNAAASPLVLTIPPALGAPTTSPTIWVFKTDTGYNPVDISDGTNTVGSLVTPATATGQIGSWCQVYSNGTLLRFAPGG